MFYVKSFNITESQEIQTSPIFNTESVHSKKASSDFGKLARDLEFEACMTESYEYFRPFGECSTPEDYLIEAV